MDDRSGFPEVPGYRLEGQVGRGGMGVVYRATHLRLGRVVALKVLAPEWSRDPVFRARFDEEARVAAAIEHPNVIPVFDAGETSSGLLYLAMRFIEGTDLGALIEGQGQLDSGRAAALITPVGGALDAAHAAGFVHRDIKPANVLIGAGPSGGEIAYLTDFGLTKLMAASAGFTQTGHLVGTPNYMSPEQIEGRRLDARSDVYSLGCTLFHALAGHAPYRRETTPAVMYAHAHEPPPGLTADRPDLAPAFDGVIRRAMAKDPRERYPSAGDFARAVQRAAGALHEVPAERSVATGEAAPVTPAPAGGSDRRTTVMRGAQTPVRRTRKRPGVPLLIASSVAVAATGVAVAFALSNSGGGQGGQRPPVHVQSAGTGTADRETQPPGPGGGTSNTEPRPRAPRSPFAGQWTGTATQYAPRHTTLGVAVALKTAISRDGTTGTHSETIQNAGRTDYCSGILQGDASGTYQYRETQDTIHCLKTTQVRLTRTASGLQFEETYATQKSGTGHVYGKLSRR
jgi:hypothetical protein